MAQVRNDPLFVGLTRPTLIFGVSLKFAMFNMIGCVIAYIQMASIKIILLAIVFHLIGYIICFKEPRIIELYLMKTQKFNACRNTGYYGANSYDV